MTAETLGNLLPGNDANKAVADRRVQSSATIALLALFPAGCVLSTLAAIAFCLALV
jgi:hypothetical protein